MDQLVIEFETRMQAERFLQQLDNLAVLLNGEKGYTVWDAITQSPSGTFYISSPTDDPRFPDWKLALGFTGTERTFPPEWAGDPWSE